MPVRRSARHRSRRSRRRHARWIVPLLPVLLVGGLYLTRGFTAGSAQAAGSAPAAGSVQAATDCASPAAQAGPTGAADAAGAPCPRPSPGTPRARATRGTPVPRRAHQHQRRARPSGRPAPPASPTASPSPAPPAATTAPPPAGGQQGSAAAQVLALINAARAQAGLPPYTLSAGLSRSSAAHNATMAGGCGLSHQCPGEAALGTRETDAGVHWTSAGENIGEGRPGRQHGLGDRAAGRRPDPGHAEREAARRRPPAEHPEQRLPPHRNRGPAGQLRHGVDDSGLLELVSCA